MSEENIIWQFPNGDPAILVNKSAMLRDLNFHRDRFEGEFYVNRMLNGINGIIERNGGRMILELPQELPSGKDEGEISVLYCDGITFENGYSSGLNRGGERIGPRGFWTRVYTPITDWNSDPTMIDLKRFYQMKSLAETRALKDLLWPEFARNVG